jgi:drug/metabolite transporter (DMT)-like permease
VLALLGIVLISLRERVPTARAAPLVPADPAPSASKAAGPDRARSAAVCALPAGMTPERARQLGVLLALGAGLGFGLLLVAFDYGGSADEYWTVTAARSTAVLTVLTLIGVNRPRLHLRRSSVPILVAVGLLLAGANVLFTTASTRGYLSVVAVLGGLSPAFTVGYAQAFLHEDMRSLQWFAAGLVFAGVICLAAG